MYKAKITYRVTSGVLKDMIFTDEYSVSIPKDRREVGKSYRGLCHWYRVLSIDFDKISK